jgi:DNA-binding NtrC family response regulator
MHSGGQAMLNERRTVLHIDDDPAFLRIVGVKLKARGIDTICVTEPGQVLQTLIAKDVRVVLCDIDMPGMNGIELLKKIKQHDGGIQVVMLTGMVSMSTVLESMRGGAEACIFKPLGDFGQLTDTLNGCFAKLDRWWTYLEDLQARRRMELEQSREAAHEAAPA